MRVRLELAERVRLGQEASDDAARLAKQQEDADSAGSLHDATVMVIGISGSGKSSTINSLLGREAVAVDPFGAGTKKVRGPPSRLMCSWRHSIVLKMSGLWAGRQAGHTKQSTAVCCVKGSPVYHRDFSSPEHPSSLLSKRVDFGTYALQTFHISATPVGTFRCTS